MLLLMSLYDLQRSGNVSFLALRFIVRITTPLSKTTRVFLAISAFKILFFKTSWDHFVFSDFNF